MKMFVLLCVVASVALAVDLDNDVIAMIDDDSSASLSGLDDASESIAMDEEAGFHNFIATHGKKYADKAEHGKRFAIWKDNLQYVRKFNADASNTFKVGMNEFADLSDKEFANTYLNPKMHEEYEESETFMAAEEERARMGLKSRRTTTARLGEGTPGQNLPGGGHVTIRWHKNTGKQAASIDWHEKSATTEVNNQAKCFACYAFATAGAIEGAKFIQTGKLQKLSAQQIVDCTDARGEGNGKAFLNHGCKGGTMVKSYKYISKFGLMKWTDYGYDAVGNSRPSCKFNVSKCKYKAAQVAQRIKGYVNIREGNEADLMNAVGTRPVSVAIDAHHRAFKLYRSGIFSLASCTTHLTHGVLMVGYGERSGQKFWKIKNSWGKTWGSNGYGHIVRGKDMCSIADWSNYPIINSEDSVALKNSVASMSQLDALANKA